jgi:hypothetical protein
MSGEAARRFARLEEKLAEVQRQLDAGTLRIRQARPGELPPPKRLNAKRERRRERGFLPERGDE